MAKTTAYWPILTSQSIAANYSTPAIDVEQYDGYSIQNVFSGLAPTASGTFSLEISNDNVNFSTYPSSATNFASGTTNQMWEVTTKRHKYVRVSLSGSATASGACSTNIYAELFTE